MQASLKKFSPAIFGIALICFILPWVNFSCQGQHIATFTGLQLVAGTTIQQHGMFGQRQSQKVDSEPLGVAVMAITALGLALSFVKNRKTSLVLGIVGFVAFTLLLLLKSKIETDASIQGQGIIQVEYAIGFWLLLMSFIAAVVLNGYLYFHSKEPVQATITQTVSSLQSHALQFPPPFPATPIETPRATADFSKLIATLVGWIAANKLLVSSIAGTAVLLIVVYKLFLQADPVKDGKRVAEAYCECNKANSQRMLEREKELLARFDAGSFKTRTVAQSELNRIESDLSQLTKCNDEAAALYNKKRSSYVGDEQTMYDFMAAFSQEQSLCTDDQEVALNDLRSQLAVKIRSLPMYAGEVTPPATSTEQIAVNPSIAPAFISGDGVRFRAEPSTEGAIMYKFSKGTQVEVLEWLEGWVKIRHNGTVGYVSSDFVRQ